MRHRWKDVTRWSFAVGLLALSIGVYVKAYLDSDFSLLMLSILGAGFGLIGVLLAVLDFLALRYEQRAVIEQSALPMPQAANDPRWEQVG